MCYFGLNCGDNVAALRSADYCAEGSHIARSFQSFFSCGFVAENADACAAAPCHEADVRFIFQIFQNAGDLRTMR